MRSTQDTLIQRIHRELLDHSDEELELELCEDGHDLNALFDEHAQEGSEKEARRLYFSELFRLQGELVKLQSWVVKTGHKVVILFEGRDAAGKGGVIKRISPMDLESRRRWEAYTKAKEIIRTHPHRRSAMAGGSSRRQEKSPTQLHLHLLGQMPYEELELPVIELPQRVRQDDYSRSPMQSELIVPQVY